MGGGSLRGELEIGEGEIRFSLFIPLGKKKKKKNRV
jgi:hypothetical protein